MLSEHERLQLPTDERGRPIAIDVEVMCPKYQQAADLLEYLGSLK